MSTPTEPGWYWHLPSKLSHEPGPALTWVIAQVLANPDGEGLVAFAPWHSDYIELETVLIYEWGPRIPDPKTLERWRMIAENTHPDFDSPPIGAPT